MAYAGYFRVATSCCSSSSSSCCCSIIILYLLFAVSASAAISHTNETDQLALLEIKKLIQGDPFNVLSSWNQSVHFCNWPGITCSSRHQRVTALNMSSFGLVGSLSSYVGNLSFLRELNLEENDFHGTIPEEIGRLFRLRYLFFANNSFQGQLPIGLSNCSNLRDIDLGANRLWGRIPGELGTLSNVLAFSISRNNFSGNIPPSLGNMSSLKIIVLARNNLQGSVPEELGKLCNLFGFMLSENKLSGTFPAPLYNLSYLQIFSISVNELHGRFPDDLGLRLPKLTSFSADMNHFSGSIPSSLSNASQLAFFTVGYNQLTGPIPLSFGRLQELQELHLGHNPLGTNEANDISFINSLKNCTSLQKLSLSRIEIGGILPHSIANLTSKLTFLWLNDNHLSGTIPVGIGDLVGLAFLELRGNKFTGNFPDSVGKLKNLQELYISENNFSAEIPFSVGNISGLQIFELSENMFQGSIPTSLSNCSTLQMLNLGRNRLTGELPGEVIGLPSLSLGLILAQNQFTGSLPSHVGKLEHLTLLDVSENQLSGEIPSTIGECQMLEALLMEGNMFGEIIPSALGKLRAIQVIDLSRNNLSGKIPISLAKLKFIASLNLSFNMLEGAVPTEGAFTNLTGLSLLGNEKLCGGIKLLNLSACPEVSKKGKKLSNGTVLALVITIPLMVILLVACLYAIYRKRGSRRPMSTTTNEYEQYPKISYAEISSLTNGFSAENLIGEGKYGSVYKGIREPGEQMIAVKVIKLQQVGGKKSFMAECEALRNLRHRNLVRIISACSSIDFVGNDFKAILFKFMSNGSLETWLHPSSSGHEEPKKLRLRERLSIAIDIASALDYLHNGCDNPVIHCDLKPSNILLDEDLCAHLSDFGLARFLFVAERKPNNSQSSSIRIRGTIGYVAPEYGMGGEVSTQGDMYSYGILLLEMFTGKRPTDNMLTENLSLHYYVKKALPHQVMEIIDPHMFEEEENAPKDTIRKGKGSMLTIEDCLVSLLQIGISCSAEMPRERMDIKDVLKELHAIRNRFLHARIEA